MENKITEKRNRPIVKRIIWGIPFMLKSPLCISNGEEVETDNDVICNYDGVPFIPGTSLAGAVREYLQLNKDTKSILGHAQQETMEQAGQMSAVYFSDTLLKETKICYRDGIDLGNGSKVKNKFDWEVIDAGAVGCFFIELVLREDDWEEVECNQLKAAVYGMQTGELRLGYRKNRGFGRMEILSVYEWEFTRETVDAWLKFRKPELVKQKQDNKMIWTLGEEAKPYLKEWDSWIHLADSYQKYATLRVPLRLTGGISIRRYSTQSGEADYEHITSNGKAVVPGTSWNGAIRSRFVEIAQELGLTDEEAKKLAKEWFGNVLTKKEDKETTPFGKSNIIIEESILPKESGSKRLQISRNQINRFDASTVMGSLYTEVAYFEGITELVLRIDKQKQDWKAIVGLLWLVIQDIQNGFLPVGGLTAIGRGIFTSNGTVIWPEGSSQQEYEETLISYLQHRKGEPDPCQK